jgi:hypothetical protein
MLAFHVPRARLQGSSFFLWHKKYQFLYRSSQRGRRRCGHHTPHGPDPRVPGGAPEAAQAVVAPAGASWFSERV